MKAGLGGCVPGGIAGRAVAAVAEVGDGRASAGAEHHGRGRDAARTICPRRWACSSALRRSRASASTVGIGRGPRRTASLQPFAVDPVADPIGEVAHHPGVVDVADCGMVELAERLGLAHEPRADGVVGVEVDPDADRSPQQLVVRLEEDPLGGGGDDALQPVSAPERRPGALEGEAARGPVSGADPGGARPGGRPATRGCTTGGSGSARSRRRTGSSPRPRSGAPRRSGPPGWRRRSVRSPPAGESGRAGDEAAGATRPPHPA